LKISSFSAPTMKVNVPAYAPVTPPETGASKNSIPSDLELLFNSLATIGEIVEESIIKDPFFKCFDKVSSTIFFTSFVLGSIVTTISDDFANYAKSPFVVIPCLFISSNFGLYVS